MKILNFTLTEETDTYFFFTLEVEEKSFWGKRKTNNYKCFREKEKKQSCFIETGDTLFSHGSGHSWLHADDTINAILTKKVKTL